jgi:hypothetical protein
MFSGESIYKKHFSKGSNCVIYSSDATTSQPTLHPGPLAQSEICHLGGCDSSGRVCPEGGWWGGAADGSLAKVDETELKADC